MIVAERRGPTREPSAARDDVLGASIFLPIGDDGPVFRLVRTTGMQRPCVGKVHVAMMRVEQRDIVEPGDEGPHFIEAAGGADILAFDRHARASYWNSARFAGLCPDAPWYDRDVDLMRRRTAARELDAVPNLPIPAPAPAKADHAGIAGTRRARGNAGRRAAALDEAPVGIAGKDDRTVRSLEPHAEAGVAQAAGDAGHHEQLEDSPGTEGVFQGGYPAYDSVERGLDGRDHIVA